MQTEKQMLSVRIPVETLKKLKLLAVEKETTMEALVTRAIEKELKRAA